MTETTPTMPAAAPARVIDILSGLLDAERNNIIRFMGEGSPYLSRATAEVRRPLQEMVDANARHVRALGELIIVLGGNPPPMSPIVSEEQYLAFLSLKFLIPKLSDAERLIITRYENAPALASRRAAGSDDSGRIAPGRAPQPASDPGKVGSGCDRQGTMRTDG